MKDRERVCEQTGLFVRLDGSRIAHPALADWTQLWPFEDPVPHAAWPSWMTLGVMDELNREFQWTEELTFHHAARLQNEWVSQVIRELVWTGMPASVAVFNRFSAAIRNTYRWPDENVLMKLLKAGQADAPAEKSELSSLIQQLILEETQFGQRLIVSYCPRWLTSSLYDALDAWFGWTREARKDRYAIQQEKRRLGDLSRKRPANTPLHIRKAAWLEIVREESVWVRLPRHARLNRSRQRYADERASEGRMIGVILFLLIFFAVPIIAWIMSWGSA